MERPRKEKKSAVRVGVILRKGVDMLRGRNGEERDGC